MLIPQHKIDEVLARADIVAVVSRHVQLKKSGREFKACCPFHNEKTPSFYVNPEKRMWWCFGCGSGGNAIGFLSRVSGKGFLDTVRELARELSVDLGGAEDPKEKERAQIRSVNELAAQHFQANLLDAHKGEHARKYLAERRVGEEAIKRFGLGYAVASWNDLGDRIVREGALEAGLKAGLLVPRPKASGNYDQFRGRLMIPIRSPEGRTIAFGGRLLEGDSGPKYLNSRESALYTKGEVLFGLDLAREAIRRSGTAILVEGYFDVIGLHQAGVQNVVALSSTTLTDKQLDLLARQGAKELVLLLDGDAAGAKAVHRLAGSILARGVSAKVAVLPEGQDPDDFANARGPSGMAELLANAAPLTEHLLRAALPGGAAAPWEAKVAALKELKPVLEGMGPSLERKLFVTRLASYLGVGEGDIERSARLASSRNLPQPAPPALPGPAARAEIAVSPAEELLCALILADPGLARATGAEALEQVRHLGVRALIDLAQKGEETPEVWAALEPKLAKRLQTKRGELMSSRWTAENRARAVADAARAIQAERVDERLKELAKELGAASPEELEPLAEERARLIELRNRLKAVPEALEDVRAS